MLYVNKELVHMNLLDGFDSLKVDKKLSALFDGVELLKVQIDKKNRKARIMVESSKIIPYDLKCLMENRHITNPKILVADQETITPTQPDCFSM